MKTLTLAILTFALTPPAMAEIVGEAHPFTSPGGVTEQCIRQERIPDGEYSKSDDKSEIELCSYDIYREEVAICPKTWSTSPGTILYSTADTGLAQKQFEDQRCTNASREQNKKLTKFKNSMNQSGTSATYSQASLLYYELSRYFDAAVTVPVAVYRSFDKDQHYARVTARAKGNGAMNIAGWKWQASAEKNPSSYNPPRDLFTADLKQIYGVLLDDKGGERYGAEFNGIRSKWGLAQNMDFQDTPGFVALRSEQAFSGAVQAGIQTAQTAKGKLQTDLGTSLSLTPVQIGVWMRELTDITLLDYIFNQQDRIGNIDYYWAWIYNDNGQWNSKKEKRKEYKDVPRNKMKPLDAPAEIANFKPELIQMGMINDNDAAGKPNYVNFTVKAQMLEKIRHYDAATYRKLIALNNDLQNKGAIFTYLRDKANITDPQLAMIVKNTKGAADILSATCKAGKLRFDLDLNRIVADQSSEDKVDCANP